MRRSLFLALVVVVGFPLTACASNTNDGREADGGNVMSNRPGDAHVGTTARVRLSFDGGDVVVRMHDTPTSRDFLSLLPLTLAVKDYAGTEKVASLPRKLSTEGAPPGSDPSVGDFAYYAPWGNLALFYKDFGYSSGLVVLGTIESGVEKLAGLGGEFTVRVEVLE